MKADKRVSFASVLVLSPLAFASPAVSWRKCRAVSYCPRLLQSNAAALGWGPPPLWDDCTALGEEPAL